MAQHTNNLLVANGIAVMGLRYYTEVAADTIGVNISGRLILNPRARINPCLYIDAHNEDDGSKHITITTRINTQWRPSRTWQLEMEFGYQLNEFANYQELYSKLRVTVNSMQEIPEVIVEKIKQFKLQSTSQSD